jgi:hypothetical protein
MDTRNEIHPKTRTRTWIGMILALLVAGGSLPLLACNDDDVNEAVEEVRDEASDAKDEILDEIDDAS